MNYRKPEDPSAIIGRVYGQLKVLSLHSTETVKTKYADTTNEITENKFLCECLACGHKLVLWEHLLKDGNIRSCGCIGGVPPKDYSGERYDMLVADHRINDISDYNYGKWVFRCDCGGTKITTPAALMQRKRKSPNSILSCGCTSKKNRKTGSSQSVKTRMVNTLGDVVPPKLLKEYKRMVRYCYYIDSHSYKYIGAAGIKIDPIWHDPSYTTNNYNPMQKNFIEWAKETGYQPGYKLERKDRDKDYGPDNCFWIADKKIADRNSDTMIRYNGEVYSLYRFDVAVLKRPKGTMSTRLRRYAPFYLEELKSVLYEKDHPECGYVHFDPITETYRNDKGFMIIMPKYEVDFYDRRDQEEI